MRVAFASLFTPGHGDTPARDRTRRVAERLADQGHDVTWLCARWWGGEHATFEEDGITYRAVVSDLAPTTFAAKLPGAIRKVDPDVIHAVNSPPTSGIGAVAAGRLSGTPVVVDWWRDHPDDDARRYRPLARWGDAIIAPSRTTKTQVREHGADGDAVRVVPESIDVKLIEETAADDRYDIVYARRLDRHANVESFLLALAELRDRDWNAAVVGEGPERERFEDTAADLRIDDRVKFLGEVPLEARVSLFKGAHVVACTATWETFATELLWALACGCVGLVEYQADSSAHELVEGRPRGRLVTGPADLADEIVAVNELEHRTFDEDFHRFDRSNVLEGYVNCYRDVIGGD